MTSLYKYNGNELIIMYYNLMCTIKLTCAITDRFRCLGHILKCTYYDGFRIPNNENLPKLYIQLQPIN
jgi:hypothetical protein